ncbi:hypothetical protein VTO73DRAFT_11641 [Trametes versicolor]
MSAREPMTYDYSLLPPELWGLVLQCLSRTDQRSCLSVCPLFRDLSRALLFSRVVIRFGMWKAHERDVGWVITDLDLMRRRGDVNTEILQHIARDARFARLVRTVSVRAYDAMEWSDEDDIQNIISALKAMVNLQSFQWYGSRPPLPSTVLDALAQTCGSTVLELDVFGVLASDEDASRYLAQFRNLKTLSLAGNLRHLPIYTRSDAGAMLKTCIENAPDTLRSFSMWGRSVWATPLHVLSGLHTLSLIAPGGLDGIGTIFTVCTQLRTLDIVTDSTECAPQMRAALEAAPTDALPHLTSFRFVSRGPEIVIVDLGPFAAFLRGRREMRRLDLGFHAPFEGLDDYARLLDIIAGLPQLEVVGLVLLGMDAFTQEHLRLLDASLPRGMSALLLSWAFEMDGAVLTRDWAAMLRRRPSLGYVHILDYGGPLDLRDALLQDPPQALKLVGYGNQVCNVERDWVTGGSAYGPRWGEEAIGFATEVEFGCADWAWLLRLANWYGRALRVW